MVDSISKPLAQEDEALIQELLEKQAAEYIVEIVNVAAPAFHKNAVVGMSQKDFARSLAAIMHAAVFPLMKEKQDSCLSLAIMSCIVFIVSLTISMLVISLWPPTLYTSPSRPSRTIS